ncbi:MAG: class I SAM-dependent methyltransferase [Planctomycetes bacterium]|nr:class I SAM-dependent methyltransferase [Planctomycetota bacterium]
MFEQTLPKARRPRDEEHPKRGRKMLDLVENDLIRRVSYEEYQEKVRDVYGGPKGALLATASVVSLHIPLGERIFRRRKFNLRGMRQLLDVGSGAGQLAGHALRYGDPELQVTCTDLEPRMLRRARQRLQRQKLPVERTRFLAADLASLPFADQSFDGVTCGYVIEHLPDPRPGLAEMARVLRPGGRMLLLATEDSFAGAWTSRVWCCRTYNRRELRAVCRDVGLSWTQEIWFTPMHKVLRAGGICVEITRQ